MPLYAFDAATLNMQLTPEFTTDKRIKVAFDVSDLRAFQEDETRKCKRLDTGGEDGLDQAERGAHRRRACRPTWTTRRSLRGQRTAITELPDGAEDEDEEQQALPSRAESRCRQAPEPSAP